MQLKSKLLLMFVSVATLSVGYTLTGYTATSAVPDTKSKFPNIGSIVNTRHNLTQRNRDGSAISNENGTLAAGNMDQARNNYGEICVYCHTPHGSNSKLQAPLWNHTRGSASYSTYSSGTLTQSIDQPGVNSKACLSCHDGTVAIDSIINMPGSGKYDKNMEDATGAAAETFLDSWTGDANQNHHAMGPANTGCMVCHQSGGLGDFFASATSFATFLIGTDLTNDHPVGIKFPQPVPPDFNDPNRKLSRVAFFDEGNLGKLDKGEIRLYDAGGQGNDYRVECASCHDPHGVPDPGNGGYFNKTFLRKNNAGSAVCQTCHAK